jgi:hypothetical protein
MEWKVEIVGDEADLSALAQTLTGVDVNISHDGQSYVLMSSAFNPSLSAEAVREKGRNIADHLAGAARLALTATSPIQVGSVYRVRDNGTRDIYVFPEPIAVQVRVFAPSIVVTHADGTVKESHPADPVRQWLLLAQNDPRVDLVLRLFAGGDLNWSNLYKVFEIVREDCGGEGAAASAGWATKKSMKLFSRTANSISAVGLDARHGIEKTQAPPIPMPISEARSLIKTLVHAWLRSKTPGRTPQQPAVATIQPTS